MDGEKISENAGSDAGLVDEVHSLCAELAELKGQRATAAHQQPTPAEAGHSGESSEHDEPQEQVEGDQSFDEDEEDRHHAGQTAAEACGVLDSIAAGPDTSQNPADVSDAEIVFKNIQENPKKVVEPDLVAELVDQEYAHTLEENSREPIHPKLAPVIKKWLFEKQDYNHIKTLCKTKYSSNAACLLPLFVNPEVQIDLGSRAKFLDRAQRQTCNTVLAAIRPLVAALDQTLKLETGIKQNSEGKKVLRVGDNLINVGTI